MGECMKRTNQKYNKDRNQLLKMGLYVVPYLKELKKMPQIVSTNACIVFQQLEYWSHLMAGTFYKFQSPPKTIQYAYVTGSSWTEELGISEDEFRTAFKQIGTRYKSKKEYKLAKEKGDVFNGKYYCSYFDKVSRLTHYFRNDVLVECEIVKLQESLKSQNGDLVFQENEITDATGTSISLDRGATQPFREAGINNPESTETTHDINHNITNERETFTSPTFDSGSQSSLLNSNIVKAENLPPYVPTIEAQSFGSSRYEQVDDASFDGVSDDEEFIRGEVVVNELIVLVPEAFEVTDEMLQWAERELVADIDLSNATKKFLLYNEGKSAKDWERRWKKWVLDERPAVKGQTMGPHKETRAEGLHRQLTTDLFADIDDDDYKAPSREEHKFDHSREIAEYFRKR
jgi:hypothetical protein